MSPPISVEDALERVLSHALLGPIESVSLRTAAGRVLASDVHADRPYPPFRKSRVDGYAVCVADLIAQPLPIAFEVAAGKSPGDVLPPGTAARVFTGAPVPIRADAMVMQEYCETHSADGVSFVSIADVEGVQVGQCLADEGLECRDGDLVAEAGTLIGPGLVGALATVGAHPVEVGRRPRVHVVATGSELVEIDVPPGPGQIRNSNALALAAGARSLGAEVVGIDRVEDSLEAHRDVLGRAVDGADIVLISGGVSVGDYDLVPGTLTALGVECVFHGVRLQPGKPIWFGVRDETLVFGLPGNPVSSLVNLELFVRPAVRQWLGQEPAAEPPLRARLAVDIGAGKWRRKYVPATLRPSADGLPTVQPVRFAGSGDGFGLARANALLIIPIDAPPRAAGAIVDVVPLRTVSA